MKTTTRLIDADMCIAKIKDMPVTYDSETVQRCIEVVSNAPTIDAEPVRHGKWIRDEFGSKCGHCGLYAYRDKFDKPWESPYCPNCGADMRGEE